jgi:hypothetical protein
MLGVYIPGWASCLLRLRSGVFESPSSIYVAFSTRRLSILVGQNAFLLLQLRSAGLVPAFALYSPMSITLAASNKRLCFTYGYAHSSA